MSARLVAPLSLAELEVPLIGNTPRSARLKGSGNTSITAPTIYLYLTLQRGQG